jgi:hypothetical protein
VLIGIGVGRLSASKRDAFDRRGLLDRAIHGATAVLQIMRELRKRGMMPTFKDPYETQTEKAGKAT